MKVKITVEFEFEIKPENYGERDPAEVERQKIKGDVGSLIGLLSIHDYDVKAEIEK